MDTIYRVTAGNGEIRGFFADTKELVNTAALLHETTPVASAALGRLLTAGVMMGETLKGSSDLITIQIKGDGPLGTILVTVDGEHHIKGYVNHPQVDLPLNQVGKLDVAKAVGKGSLTVIRDLGLKEPYVGQIELVSGEIADDLTYYFASSEQTPSVVALGVLVDVDYRIRQSGGFIVQLMPGASEESISLLEKNIHSIQSVTQMLEEGIGAPGIIDRVFAGFEYQIHETSHPSFYCNCNRQRVEKALISIGKKDIQSLIDEGEPIEMKCHFCNKKYQFELDELKEILESL
ncbi:MAG: Hsp33 family molecular chaperone HslO [Vallitaleaceae bacterium]|nr:Hsp33 family molecular chaperone HslO [Vallitaleaceae bacterium]